MKYDEIKKELDNMEHCNLSSTIKYILLKEFDSLLLNTNRKKTHKISFIYDDNIDEAISDLEYRFNLILNEFKDQCIELKRIKVKNIER